MSFDPYIHFRGTCRDAMAFYQGILGGTLEVMGYADAPDATQAMRSSDLVMHATLHLGGRMLLAADFPPGHAGTPQAAVTISHIAPTDADARRIFAALSEDATVMMEYQPTFWSDGFGMLKDRFGTQWMVSAPWRQPT